MARKQKNIYSRRKTMENTMTNYEKFLKEIGRASCRERV